MSFFKKLFGKKSDQGRSGVPPLSATTPSPVSRVGRPLADATPPPSDPSKDPNMIRVHDAYGREMFITKAQWRDSVLLGHIQKVWDKPDELAPTIVQSLQDGFAADVVKAAAHLADIDPDAERGHVLLAVTHLQLKNYDAAEAALTRLFRRHGETGSALTNLAKVQSGRGDDALALATLWRGLTLDPNQENGLGWYAVIHHEKDGPAAGLDAFRRVAALPGAWRARLWLARDHLDQRDLPAALALYAEALACAPRPAPTDLLVQLSGDLGNHAHLPEIIQLVEPHFDVALHGLPVGNNLIKANLDLGRLDAARALLDRLYAQNRPDWKQTLSFWDTEIAKARVAIADAPTPDKLQVTLLSMVGPVWLPPASPAAELFPAKPADAPVVAFIGGSAEMPPSDNAHRVQLADGPGRLSRALPLYLAEQVEFGTEAAARTLVPWMVKPSTGFVLSGGAWSDSEAAANARRVGPDQKPADYIVITHLRCAAEPWQIELRLVRTIDAKCLAKTTATCPATDPAHALPSLTRDLLAALTTHADIVGHPLADASPRSGTAEPFRLTSAPPVSGLSSQVSAFSPQVSSNYLLRLEQLLAVRTAGLDPARPTLNGEREILDGHLQLCLDQPESVSIRVMFAHTLRGMKKARPDILPEIRERADRLQTEKPLPEPAQSIVARIFAETFAA